MRAADCVQIGLCRYAELPARPACLCALPVVAVAAVVVFAMRVLSGCAGVRSASASRTAPLSLAVRLSDTLQLGSRCGTADMIPVPLNITRVMQKCE